MFCCDLIGGIGFASHPCKARPLSNSSPLQIAKIYRLSSSVKQMGQALGSGADPMPCCARLKFAVAPSPSWLEAFDSCRAGLAI